MQEAGCCGGILGWVSGLGVMEEQNGKGERGGDGEKGRVDERSW